MSASNETLVTQVLQAAGKPLRAIDIVRALKAAHSVVLSRAEANKLLYHGEGLFAQAPTEGACPVWVCKGAMVAAQAAVDRAVAVVSTVGVAPLQPAAPTAAATIASPTMQLWIAPKAVGAVAMIRAMLDALADLGVAALTCSSAAEGQAAAAMARARGFTVTDAPASATAPTTTATSAEPTPVEETIGAALEEVFLGDEDEKDAAP